MVCSAPFSDVLRPSRSSVSCGLRLLNGINRNFWGQFFPASLPHAYVSRDLSANQSSIEYTPFASVGTYALSHGVFTNSALSGYLLETSAPQFALEMVIFAAATSSFLCDVSKSDRGISAIPKSIQVSFKPLRDLCEGWDPHRDKTIPVALSGYQYGV